MARKQWFGLNNLVLGSGTTVSASSASASYPVSNLKTFSLKPGWWSTGVSSEWLKWDLGSAQNIDLFAVARQHNLTAAATVRIQLNATDVWTSPSVDELVTVGAGSTLIHRWSSAQNYRWARLTLADSANPDEVLRINHVYLGTATELGCAFLRRHRPGRTAQGAVLPDAAGDFYLVQSTERLWRVEAEFMAAAADQAILDASLETALAGRPLMFCQGDDAEVANTRLVKIVNCLDPEIENLGGGWRSYRLDLAELGGGLGA